MDDKLMSKEAYAEQTLWLRAKDGDEVQRLVAVAALGMCRALATGTISPAYTCHRLFGPALLAVLMVLLVGCGTASRVVRLDTGRTDTIVFTPRSGAEPVELDDGAFKEAVAKLARDVRPPTRPQEAARRLLPGEHLDGESTAAENENKTDETANNKSIHS